MEVKSYVAVSMDLQSVMQSEVNQKEEYKCHILMHIYGIWKTEDEPIFRARVETQTYRTDVWTQGRRGWDKLKE